ncbi:hypothetical protein B0J18DRAFT_279013 [Chaetomium sp. MPI-SDFR-AT-0129]|nr:hypothetical protein B0J18DRAFT_279013 [Chaetomium sp. MPI-SDFR-AT-0129]
MSDDQPLSGRPLPSSFDHDERYKETPSQKVVRKLKEEPFIPIFTTLTVVALVKAIKAIRRGDSHEAQRMFRARIAFHALTVVSMCIGGWYYAEDRNKTKEAWQAEQLAKAEEQRAKWIRELEIRDEEEKALQEMLAKKRRRAAGRGGTAEPKPQGVAAQAEAAFKAANNAPAGSEALGVTEAQGQANNADTKSKVSPASLGGWLGGSNTPGPEVTAEDKKDQKP